MVSVMFRTIIILSLLSLGTAFAATKIPEQILPPAGYLPVLTAHAKGDQIYQCTQQNGEYSWQTLAPDAKLFDDKGNIVGNHTAGPLWEYKEGSRVVGRVVNKVEITPGAITWLLVEVVSRQGKGLFSNVSFVNRINTQGGLAPVGGCDANHLGGEKRVPYSADYVFYGK